EKFKTAVEDDVKAGQTAQVNGTPTFFINGIALVGAQPYAAFKTAIDNELNGASGEVSRTTIETGRLPALGEKNAKVTIIEFADLECPFCKRYFTDAFPQIKKDYIDTGKAAYYYRHFPLDFHPLAKPFAQASECANEQGKFWEMHDKIFQEQA
ncbi:MAG: thioredoxin domain-containing protein, partial [Candidatus Levybacteria bacterium]|nr:thioredoxin domain-containing protein [Candidatus Levybacteria bacterium]